MIRVAVCGGVELVGAARSLGLAVGEPADVVLVDARTAEGVALAAAILPDVPRVVVASPDTWPTLRAAGVRNIAADAAPETIGPLLARAAPRTGRSATRCVVITAARGGVGRTLLAANLALRLGVRRSLWLIDATGTGGAAWWLGAACRPWPDLEPLTRELTTEHLRVVAAEPCAGVRLLGGSGPAPTPELLGACIAALTATGELVVLDAPALADERTRLLTAEHRPDTRVLVLSYADEPSVAALQGHDLGEAWLVASQCSRVPGRSAFRVLPRDDAAVAAAAMTHGAARGALGRAYDELAELVAIDVS